MKKKLLTLLFCSCLLNVFSQKLVEISFLETRSAEELNLLFAFLGVSVNNGVDAYKVLYETPDTDGSIDTASGLLVIPILEGDTPLPILAYQHGTSSNKEDVPSRITQEAFLLYYFAGQGFACTAADYLGLGDSKRTIHPYLHAGTQASAAIDLVRASKSYMTAENIAFNDQLFITGYSQGGHASMAMHQVIEQTLSDEFTVTAASHMSGPYNLENTIVNISIEDGVYDTPSYIVWMFVAYQSAYNNIYDDLNTVFKPAYAPLVAQFSNGEITRGELNTLLIDKLTEEHGASYPNRVFTDEYLLDLQTNPDNPMRIALRDNDLFNWTPTAPTHLLYCKADEQVPYTNAVVTDSVMNARGAAFVNSIDINSEEDHGGCVIPATENTAAFFVQFLEGATTNTKEVQSNLAFSIRPNPANQAIQLVLPALENAQDIVIQLANVEGRVVAEQRTNSLSNSISLNTSKLATGLYFVRIHSIEGFWVEKLVVERR